MKSYYHDVKLRLLSEDFYPHFFKGIKESFQEERVKVGDTRELEYYKDNFKIAALLHDLGVGPLSSIGNSFYNKEEIGNYLKIKCDELLLEYNKIFGSDLGSEQERMSCYFILSKMAKIIFNNRNIDLEFIL